jgi:hypothetical protein
VVSQPGADLIGIIRNASPTLKRLLGIPDIRTLAWSVLERDMVVVRDEEPLTRCPVGAAGLDAERRSVATEARSELDAQVGTGDLNGGRAVLVDEQLGLRIVAWCAGGNRCIMSA